MILVHRNALEATNQEYIHPFILLIDRNGIESIRNIYLSDIFELADSVTGNGLVSKRVTQD